jgi:dTMP kinase
MVRALNGAATNGLRPDITVYLALPVEEAMPRATLGGADRIEGESHEFHLRVLRGFESIASSEPGRVLRVDASGTPQEVASRVLAAVAAHPALQGILVGSE